MWKTSDCVETLGKQNTHLQTHIYRHIYRHTLPKTDWLVSLFRAAPANTEALSETITRKKGLKWRFQCGNKKNWVKKKIQRRLNISYPSGKGRYCWFCSCSQKVQHRRRCSLFLRCRFSPWSPRRTSTQNCPLHFDSNPPGGVSHTTLACWWCCS